MIRPHAALGRLYARLVTATYTPHFSAVGAGLLTVAFTGSAMSDWSFFDLSFEEFIIPALLLLAYIIFISSLWIRAMILPAPPRRRRKPPIRPGHMSLSGAGILFGYSLLAGGASMGSIIPQWAGLGLSIIAVVLLAREATVWIDQQTQFAP